MTQERCPACGQLIRKRTPDLDAQMRQTWALLAEKGNADAARAAVNLYKSGEIGAAQTIVMLSDLLARPAGSPLPVFQPELIHEEN